NGWLRCGRLSESRRGESLIRIDRRTVDHPCDGARSRQRRAVRRALAGAPIRRRPPPPRRALDRGRRNPRRRRPAAFRRDVGSRRLLRRPRHLPARVGCPRLRPPIHPRPAARRRGQPPRDRRLDRLPDPWRPLRAGPVATGVDRAARPCRDRKRGADRRNVWGVSRRQRLATGHHRAARAFPHSAAAPTYIGTQLHAFANGTPGGFILRAFAIPHAELAGIGVAIVEIAIGLCAFFGLLTRWAAAGGMALNLLLFLTASWHTTPYFL